MNPVAFLIFPYVLDTPKNANPTKSMQILHASYANPMQIPHTEHRKRGPNVGPRCLLRSHLGSSSSAYMSLCCSSLIVAMPPKGAQTKAKAKALARQRRIQTHNERRGQRESAMKTINALTSEMSVPVSPLSLRSASSEEVEKRVRLLEARLSSPDQMQRLRSAAKLYVDSGGVFSAPVVADDQNTASPVARHRVLVAPPWPAG